MEKARSRLVLLPKGTKKSTGKIRE